MSTPGEFRRAPSVFPEINGRKWRMIDQPPAQTPGSSMPGDSYLREQYVTVTLVQPDRIEMTEDGTTSRWTFDASTDDSATCLRKVPSLPPT